MPEKAADSHSGLIPRPLVPAGAEDLAGRVRGQFDGPPRDGAAVDRAPDGMDATLDLIAASLYNLASMLVGEGEDGVRVVETAIATAEVSAGDGARQARKAARLALCRAALEVLVRRDPQSLAAPKGTPGPATCIEEDELDSVGVSAAELERMLSGPNRNRVRTWLAELPIVLRTVFALRVVAGLNAEEAAALLVAHGGTAAAGWTPAFVREIFRQGLCSLASQLLHAATAR